ncbi:excinuclease ABC subunit UvrC [Roseofilum casamattae]|uniref:UvrABC system protein C n=1 Tax=Roseofilum casamattae BLCC-M143 TaxID=3022442 RepID=A0ABT7BXP5_9CYAN|nr:excinuclease ABC subunit UvrC [Roseofilum casamattae]MDJ1183940.1 excinuclease ABC subunit UvrC [Roseofilum casamattae BLCC-M143]
MSQSLVKNPEELEKKLAQIPREPGVYVMKDSQDNILYIGKSKVLRSRVRSYFRQSTNHNARIALMVRQVVDIEWIITDTEAEALALEANLIKRNQPPFNVLLKDDKKYPYLCITWSEDYPHIFITRKRKTRKPKDRYYGPYVDVGQLRQTLELVKQIFPQRQRWKPLYKDRTCLNYDIGRCPGVCQSLIPVSDYREMMQDIAKIFQGRTEDLVNSLTEKMERASEDLNFEQAAKLRDQITALSSLNLSQKMTLPDDRISRDAIALAGNDNQCCIQLFQVRGGRLVGRLGFFAIGSLEAPGAVLQRVLEDHYQTVEPEEIPAEILVQYPLSDEDFLLEFLHNKKQKKVSIHVPQRQIKAELIDLVYRNAQSELERVQKLGDRTQQSLADLTEILDLPEIPQRIEGYDISHLQGSNAVASQVVFINGIPAKQHYRHYKIKNPNVQPGRSDDFASLAETIQRRFRKFIDNPETPRQGNPDFPDLLLIDGGKGQLSSVVSILSEYHLIDDLRVISLAKQREEIFQPGESFPLTTNPEQPGVQLLRRVRDESHRFAVTFHRQQRGSRFLKSRLDDIPNLGYQRQKLLLDRFKSLDAIEQATPEQLQEVSGIGPQLAENIYHFFDETRKSLQQLEE